MPPVLLLTASVDPRGCAFTARADTQVRLDDYRWALRAWLDAGMFTRIVWCENSLWPCADLDELASFARARGIELELLSFSGQDYDRALGKGYGELGIIAHALAHARLLADSGSAVVKVTGRYFVADCSDLLAVDWLTRPVAPGAEAVVCDLRANLTVADCRVFAATPAFLRERLLPLRALANDSAGCFFEHVLARAVHATMAAGGAWTLMPSLPAVVGVGGSFDRAHHRTWSKRLRHLLKRRLLRY